MLRGSVGFAIVSIAAFSVWAFAGRWLGQNFGEAGLYIGCLIIFLGVSGLLLRSLVLGPNSLGRFYKIFTPAFLAYAMVWSAAWFELHFGAGEWAGSLGGCAVFVALVGRGFGNYRGFAMACLVMFVCHSAGYFLGGKCMGWILSPGGGGGGVLSGFSKAQLSVAGKLSWGLFYGLGFGAGMGYVFFVFQRTRMT